jgi:hypothetical protein
VLALCGFVLLGSRCDEPQNPDAPQVWGVAPWMKRGEDFVIGGDKLHMLGPYNSASTFDITYPDYSIDPNSDFALFTRLLVRPNRLRIRLTERRGLQDGARAMLLRDANGEARVDPYGLSNPGFDVTSGSLPDQPQLIRVVIHGVQYSCDAPGFRLCWITNGVSVYGLEFEEPVLAQEQREAAEDMRMALNFHWSSAIDPPTRFQYGTCGDGISPAKPCHMKWINNDWFVFEVEKLDSIKDGLWEGCFVVHCGHPAVVAPYYERIDPQSPAIKYNPWEPGPLPYPYGVGNYVPGFYLGHTPGALEIHWVYGIHDVEGNLYNSVRWGNVLVVAYGAVSIESNDFMLQDIPSGLIDGIPNDPRVQQLPDSIAVPQYVFADWPGPNELAFRAVQAWSESRGFLTTEQPGTVFDPDIARRTYWGGGLK